MYEQCRHIQTNGYRCRQIALNEGLFCYYHQNRQPRRRRSIIRTQPHTQTQTYDYGSIPVSGPGAPRPESGTWVNHIQPPVELLFPEDTASIQINLYRIAVAQAENRIDTRTANSMTWNQQVCLINLARKPLIESTPAPAPTHSRSRDTSSDDSDTTYSDPSGPSTPVFRPVHRVILTPDGDEIAPPVEILEDNEAEPIHHKGCPCRECAEKYRNQPPEEHHPACQCGLCEERGPMEEDVTLADLTLEDPNQLSVITNNDVILSEVEGPAVAEPATFSNGCHPERSEPGSPSRPGLARWGGEAESRDLLLPETSKIEGAPSLAQPRVGSDNASTTTLGGAAPCSLIPKPRRVARAASLLSGSTNRDPLNRPWSIAEYTFGDAIRRHEAQYAARAAAALAVGIEPPPYQPFITGLIRPGTPEWEEEQQMQQQSSEYWAEHFRKQIAERPDIQQYLEEEEQAKSDTETNRASTETA